MPEPEWVYDPDTGLYRSGDLTRPAVWFPATLVNPDTQEAAAYPAFGVADRLFAFLREGREQAVTAGEQLLMFEAKESGSPGMTRKAWILNADRTHGPEIDVYDWQHRYWWIGMDDVDEEIEGIHGAYGTCYPNGNIVTVKEQAKIIVGMTLSTEEGNIDPTDATIFLRDVFAFDGGMLPALGVDGSMTIKNLGIRICSGAFVYGKLCCQDGLLTLSDNSAITYDGGQYEWMDSPCCPGFTVE